MASQETKFGKYILVRRIASGGMAEIYLARQEGMAGFAREVVIKRIHAHLGKDPEFVNMFLDEARLVAKLSHPNIVSVHEFGQEDEAHYLAMEFVDGNPLSAAIKKSQGIQPAHSLRIASEMCAGLSYAHTLHDESTGDPLGIVHRDISPQNVLIGYDGSVKLIDFGIAKAETQSHKTKAGSLKGKYSYMSPEQARGRDVGQRTDIHAIGIVLWESLTGRSLFHRESMFDTMEAVMSLKPRSVRLKWPKLDPEIDDIINKSLEKDPKDRYQTAADMQLAIDEFIASHNLHSSSLGLARYARKLFDDEEEAAPSPAASTQTTPSGARSAPPPIPPNATPTGQRLAPGQRSKPIGLAQEHQAMVTPSGAIRLPQSGPGVTPSGGINLPPTRPDVTPSGGTKLPSRQPHVTPTGGTSIPPVPDMTPSGGTNMPPIRPDMTPSGGTSMPPIRPDMTPSGGTNMPPIRPDMTPSGGTNMPPVPAHPEVPSDGGGEASSTTQGGEVGPSGLDGPGDPSTAQLVAEPQQAGGQGRGLYWGALAALIVIGVLGVGLVFAFGGNGGSDTTPREPVVQNEDPPPNSSVDAASQPEVVVVSEEAGLPTVDGDTGPVEPPIDEEPPALVMGYLSVFSTPRGAAMVLDGRPTGERTTVRDFPVDPGEHQVELVLDGHRRWRGTVTVGAEETETVRAHLQGESGGVAKAPTPSTPSTTNDDDGGSGGVDYGLLSLDTTPPSRVFLGRRSLGRTPLESVEVETGQYQITMVIRSGRRFRRPISIRTGRSTRHHFDLLETSDDVQ